MSQQGRFNLPMPESECHQVLCKIDTFADIQQLFRIINANKIREDKLEFVLLIIPCNYDTLNKDDIYALSKFCDLVNSELTTQCVTNTIVEPNYLRLPQLNMAETMLLGVNVNHPGEGDRGRTKISVAAAVASTFD